MSDIYFTADLHFGHAKVIGYSHRPFQSVEEMDTELIGRWNARVKPADRIYVLGDFSFHRNERTREILDELQGQIHLVLGNHDKGLNATTRDRFDSVAAYKELRIEGQKLVLLHYAMLTWNEAHYGSWHLHGHSHGTLRSQGFTRRADVGVDCWNYAPVSFEEIAAQMATRQYVAEDHHGADFNE